MIPNPFGSRGKRLRVFSVLSSAALIGLAINPMEVHSSSALPQIASQSPTQTSSPSVEASATSVPTISRAKGTDTPIPAPTEAPTGTPGTASTENLPSPEEVGGTRVPPFGITDGSGFHEIPLGVLPSPKQRLIHLLGGSDVDTDAEPYAYLDKIDSNLQDLIADALENRSLDYRAMPHGLLMSSHDEVQGDVYTTISPGEASTALESLGMQIEATNEEFRVLEGRLPLNSIMEIADLSITRAVIPVFGFGVDVGSVTSQGDASHNGPAARALGMNGTGIVVGVISDSIDMVGGGISDSQGTGDLPATVTVLTDGPSGSHDEGRAMAEMIYDTAPGITTMFFSTGSGGATTKATSISNLVAAGVDIIADDIYYLSEPFFQDGQAAAAADNAVASGVAYFVSAGNRGRQSYESDYELSSNNWHDFNPGSGVDQLQRIASIANGNNINVTLQWNDPTGGIGNPMSDYDLYLFSDDGNFTILGSSTNNNSALRQPYEYVSWTNSTGSALNVGVAILRNSGDGGSFMKYIMRGSSTIAEWDTASNAINPGAAAAANTMTIAAVRWNETGLNDPESYSSRGPITRYFPGFVVRQKPILAGADCVTTTVPGFNPFCGTSAGTPSVAGVAALVLDMAPGLSPAQLRSILTNPANTIDCSAAGNPDFDCGFGFVLADDAVEQAKYGVVVNELDTGDLDKVEIFNDDSQTAILTDWHLKIYNTTGSLVVDYTMPNGFTIPSGGYVVLHEISGTNNSTNLYMNQNIPWIEGGSGAALLTSGATGIDFVRFGSSIVSPPVGTSWWGSNPVAPGVGTSLGRDASSTDTDNGADWCLQGLTFGAQNAGCVTGTDSAGAFNPLVARFFLRNDHSNGSPDYVIRYGKADSNWIPLAGDWDGDGDDTIGIYNPDVSRFMLRNFNSSGSPNYGYRYGPAGEGWLPVLGDWDGDGDATPGVYDPTRGLFLLANSHFASSFDIRMFFGPPDAGWIPLVGDWDGDGDDTLGVYDPLSAEFRLRNTNTTGGYDINLFFGPADQGWVPITGDWDADGAESVGVYNPVTAQFRLRDALSTGPPDVAFRFGAIDAGWMPVAGDWDGQ
jgi:hypothetical protein